MTPIPPPAPPPSGQSSFDDPVVAAFMASFMEDEAVPSALDAWCNAQCEVFKGCSFEGEHPLEFTALHQQYIAQLEAHVGEFLTAHNLRVNDLASRLLRLRRRCGGSGVWLPALIDYLDYEVFFTSMAARAEGDALEQAALTSAAAATAEPAGVVNLSGTYRADMSRSTGADEIKEVLSKAGTPSAVQKLYIHALGRMKLIVNQPSSEQLQIQIKLPLFPVNLDTYIFDGASREKTIPLFGGKRHVRSWIESEGKLFRTSYQVRVDSWEAGGDHFDIYMAEDSSDCIVLRQTMYYANGGSGEVALTLSRQS
eukprot:TRINITY_DN52037_c0_g1_i1.p1 TRINITY_DN52037_c0_g1~~TRINITY_DN52037_c0_g1_i1.p1  ORF type:complete len:311 (+),score=79.70 TRINITY_DN52037_c0_g1_i1:109-1041(+)